MAIALLFGFSIERLILGAGGIPYGGGAPGIMGIFPIGAGFMCMLGGIPPAGIPAGPIGKGGAPGIICGAPGIPPSPMLAIPAAAACIAA